MGGDVRTRLVGKGRGAEGCVGTDARVVFRAAALVLSAAVSLACGAGCKGNAGASSGAPSSLDASTSMSASPSPLSSTTASLPSSAPVVAEAVPRCRAEGPKLAIPGEDVVAGEAVVVGDGLYVGVVRGEGAKRLASVVRASLDPMGHRLSGLRMTDIGDAFGDAPPPMPRERAGKVVVASIRRRAGDPPRRALEIARLEDDKLALEATILQQADDSMAFDIAAPEGGNAIGLVAWDEDEEPKPARRASRGVVKVQAPSPDAKARAASPDTSDAEAPKLLARPGGGYWLAWMAERSESDAADAGSARALEGPGEKRRYRWVELVALDAKGEAASPVRRISSDKGHASAFDLVRGPNASPEGGVIVVVQDEAAKADGAGGRVLRFTVDGDATRAADVVERGVGPAVADLLTGSAIGAGAHLLAFTDSAERTQLAPLAPTLDRAGPITTEPALDGARVLASASPNALFVVGTEAGRSELRHLVCR